MEMTEEEKAQLTEALKATKEENVDFNELKDMPTQLEQMFNAGKYQELIDYAEITIGSGETASKKFHEIGLALAILSSQKWIDSLRTLDMDANEAEELVLKAQKNYINEMYDDVKDAVRNLKELTSELKEEQKTKLQEKINEMESHLEEAKRIGTNVGSAASIIEQAKISLDNNQLVKSAEDLRKTQVLMGEAGEDRMAVIRESMTFVEEVIERAKEIGTDVEEPLDLLEKAKEFFDDEDYQMCMHNTIQAEELTTELIQKQVDKALLLKKFLKERYKAVATTTPSKPMKFEELPKEENICPTCKNPLEYIEQYKRWYCYSCQKYI